MGLAVIVLDLSGFVLRPSLPLEPVVFLLQSHLDYRHMPSFPTPYLSPSIPPLHFGFSVLGIKLKAWTKTVLYHRALCSKLLTFFPFLSWIFLPASGGLFSRTWDV